VKKERRKKDRNKEKNGRQRALKNKQIISRDINESVMNQRRKEKK
jgi:hypothetical protein